MASLPHGSIAAPAAAETGYLLALVSIRQPRELTVTQSRRRVVTATVLDWLQHRFPRKTFVAVLEALEDTHILPSGAFLGNHFLHKHL